MPDSPLILAIEAGSLSVRCSLFDPTGAIVGASARWLAIRTPAPECQEQDANEIWMALLDALTELAADHDPRAWWRLV
jgi:sugar (pentulose or hexulose) kinase